MNQLVLHPQVMQFLWVVVAASLIEFAGSEIVAVFRISSARRSEVLRSSPMAITPALMTALMT
jgi:hypothetical protein